MERRRGTTDRRHAICVAANAAVVELGQAATGVDAINDASAVDNDDDDDAVAIVIAVEVEIEISIAF